jgi:hypothetical protein
MVVTSLAVIAMAQSGWYYTILEVIKKLKASSPSMLKHGYIRSVE